MRSLYDQEFLEAGCPPEDFDEVYKVDDTIGTWVTNIVILGFCLLAVLKLSMCSPNNKNNNKYMIAFFFFNGLSFGVAGVFHAVVHRSDDPSKDPYTRAFYALYGISTVCFSLAILGLVTDNAVAWWVVALITTALTVYTTIVIDHFVAGVLVNIGIILPAACIIYGIQACRRPSHHHKCNNVVKIVGILGMILGVVIQLVLRGTCGDGGYEDCFEDCPLPHPTKFNHNALFHVVHLVGVILLAAAEARNPSLRSTPHADDDGDGMDYKAGGAPTTATKQGLAFSSEEVSEA
mmetsp:Transcript_135915/g.202124  ORF Transcript_135915/g.202124 Transcript_135915/m.202124 type:complete len:292 (-) Transcript_135915:119-994(-)|eukprot:CAMPEP_0117026336 /NCGR_PEP_ID=MMETSP0472-20121206/19376_1 /TAXON_ID=693140 ORGANISM="Tiarina fusus, Strain LIS" /NCGR_SAMPLE_ID=MMETSP0472 /ASSEMBLY_ACC=CAM_ASM_000603 /LENGTH=291 /DNA_ID=CAMNT_0004733323 /DNA_START=132 /DNA_END=1007 /DNA_ORIENTATION=-